MFVAKRQEDFPEKIWTLCHYVLRHQCILYTKQKTKKKLYCVCSVSLNVFQDLLLPVFCSSWKACVDTLSSVHSITVSDWSSFSIMKINKPDAEISCLGDISSHFCLLLLLLFLSSIPSHHALPLFLLAVPPFLLIHNKWKVEKLQQFLHISHNHDIQDPFFPLHPFKEGT